MPSIPMENVLLSATVVVLLLAAFVVRFTGRVRWISFCVAVLIVVGVFSDAAPEGDHAGLGYLLFGTFFAMGSVAGLVAGGLV